MVQFFNFLNVKSCKSVILPVRAGVKTRTTKIQIRCLSGWKYMGGGKRNYSNLNNNNRNHFAEDPKLWAVFVSHGTKQAHLFPSNSLNSPALQYTILYISTSTLNLEIIRIEFFILWTALSNFQAINLCQNLYPNPKISWAELMEYGIPNCSDVFELIKSV